MHTRFSEQLDEWLSGKGHKTISSLDTVFGEKTFAVTFLVLMFIPALPIPTGGITHIFEIIVMLLSLELIIGLRTIWLPKSLRKREIPSSMRRKLLPLMMRRIAWAEKYSRPRMAGLTKHPFFTRIIGLLVFGFTLAAFLSPPFSGLDTLPALGIVFLSLGLILEDMLLVGFGTAIGAIGCGLIFTIGASLTLAIKKFLHL